MGDGGVACLPSQLIMEQFSVRGGKTNGKTMRKSSSKSSIKLVKVKPKMKQKKDKGSKLVSKISVLSKEVSEKDCNGEVSSNNNKDEVEEGELGTLPLPIENGDYEPEKPKMRHEIEKGEFVPERWRNSSGESDRNEWRSSKDELEKGEFVPDRWCRSEVGHNADEYSYYPKVRRFDNSKNKWWKWEREQISPSAQEKGWKFNRDTEWTTTPSGREKSWRADRESPPSSGKDMGWKGDGECEWTPPSSGKYSSEKEHSRSSGGSQRFKKFTSRYEAEMTPKNSFKIAGEEGFSKNDISNGKNHTREYPFNNRLKRHGNDSDSCCRNYWVEYDEYSSSKNRKLSDNGSRFSSDDYSGRTFEKPFKKPSERYSSNHFSSSRAVHDRRISSPHQSERSTLDRARNYDRARSPAHYDRSPYGRGHLNDRSKSPYDRSRHYDNRYESPSYVERSPRDPGQDRDARDHTPTLLERSPRDLSRYNDHQESNRKAGVGEKRVSDYGSKGQEGKYNRKDSGGKETESLPKESQDTVSCSDITPSVPSPNEELCKSPIFKSVESSQENGVIEEPTSMEEDMDICNTPPHVPVVAADTSTVAGKWYYLDHFGEEQGPSNLSDLKTLMGEGYLVSDHFVKHSDSDRWVTVESAVSPLMTENFPSVVPDTVTQLVCPPEAPGNLLEDNVNATPCNLAAGEMMASSFYPTFDSKDGLAVPKPVEDLHIDERVGVLLEGVMLLPDRELEMLAEVLQMTIEHVHWERWGKVEGFDWHQLLVSENCDDKGTKGLSSVSEYSLKGIAESRPASSENDSALCFSDTSECFSGQWAVKGGDWKENDEAAHGRTWKRKLVLNDGYPLCCQMPKFGCEDPRWQQKDELYCPSQSRKLDLPPWAFTLLDELNDPSSVSKSIQTKPALVKGVKGTMLPVIRINACVVNNHGSFLSESRTKGKLKEKYSAKSLQPYLTTSDTKRLLDDSHSKTSHERDWQDSCKRSTSFSIPNDRLCKMDELQLHLGDWYYLDGAGHERGPSSFSELQGMADQGVIQKHSSVFRKRDKIWVPVTYPSEPSGIFELQNNVTSLTSLPEANVALLSESQSISSRFHDVHPQFIGYTRGKLHELVMKSYKSREFAAAINEVLDPWINARQPKKEMEKYSYLSDHSRASKRARTGGIEEEYDMEDDESTSQKNEVTFDDLCVDITFSKDKLVSEVENESWDLLDGHVLARVFHFLRADFKSLIYAALTCKHWRSAVKFYKGISRQIDCCSIAPNCPDPVIWKVMNDYNKDNITSLLLRGCTGITSAMLEELLQSFRCLSSIDIRGCTQLEDLVCKFPKINWIRSASPQLKIRSLNHLTDKSSSASNQMDYSSGLREYLESSDKRDSANQLFRRSLYKRSKLFDARKSSSILSRDAQLRRLAMKKFGNGYKRMEEFIAVSLRDIMKENTFEFFETKVGEMEERMKNGYYTSRGLHSVKEDISRMCRDAIKIKNRADARDVNRIITLFIQLATSLEKDSKLAYGGDAMMKSWKDESPPGFTSSSSKYKKNLSKASERKQVYRSNGSSFFSGLLDSGDYASDREIRRKLSKLNKSSLDSGSDTSDDFEKSSRGSVTDDTNSDTESDLELQSAGSTVESKKDTYFSPDDGFESFADEREWGARMTKVSLVPPVTRKYEVIDHYVIVADEEEVRRKMQVSLPEDYDEKLNAQRNGTEESDMEIPEVKDYKPRKSVGDEVIEQEVYGIDPYTHNLLLDSMPDESESSLLDKHLFIEDVLLRSLNKQVRNFTGSGNTPMIYPLKPVFEHLLETSKENHDKRTMRICQFILKAIDSRPEDKYVAYRKGLGVVCDKEDGFSEDDFVVEFLGEVYPTWKWFEKQDGIRALQKNNNEAPEFYNIYLERPKGDANGYDLVVVDAMHKANYASRICHSCRPNCEAKVTAVDGHYQIGIYSVRPIAYGEEITFDYNSVTESKEEYEASVCLCGNQVCRGSYLNLTGEGAYQKVLKEFHGLLDRHHLLLEACELNSVSEEDYIDLGKAGLGSCLLGGLPDWLIAYSARLVRFINFERTKLPSEILRHNIEEKNKYFAEIRLEVEKSDAEIQAEGVYNQRLQNLALTIDKVRYVMRCVFGDPKKAPPPLERLSPEAAVSHLWKGEGSLVEELIQCMAPHLEDTMLRDLKTKIHAHDPSGSDDIEMELQRSLLWLRDEVRNLPCTYKSRHDAAADLIHIYAYTKSFLKIREYNTITSLPVYITQLDLGPKYADKLGSGVHEYCKTYGETYCLGQLIFWYNQNAEPDAILGKVSRGCLSLPDIGSFYAKVQKPSRQRVYGPRTVKFMLSRMEKQPQRPWPKDRIWSFKSSPLRIIGSPMLDAVLHEAPIDREIIHWLKHRPAIFQAMWDR